MRSPDETADRIRRKARQIFEDPDQWLNREHDMLGGLTPNKLISSNEYEQAKQVENLLDQLMHGLGP